MMNCRSLYYIGLAFAHLVIPFLWMCKLYLLNANRIFKNITQLIIYLEISIKTTCFQILNKIHAAIVMLPANNIHVKNTLFVLSHNDNKNKVFSAFQSGHFAVKNSLIITYFLRLAGIHMLNIQPLFR